MKKLFKNVKVTDYISAMGALFGLVFGIWVINQNTQAIKTSQDIFLVSLPQSLEINVPTNNDQNFYVKNTNLNSITNVEVYFITYLSSSITGKLFYRRKPMASKILNKLVPGERINIPLEDVQTAQRLVKNIDNENYKEEIDKGVSNEIVVVVFHREIDNKRFVNVEPYTKATSIDKKSFSYGYVYGKKDVAETSVDFSDYASKIKEMETMEKVFFRAD